MPSDLHHAGVPDAGGPEGPYARVSRLVLRFLPAFSVLLVGGALLVTGTERSLVFARLLGGPTEGAGPWTGRVQLIERSGSLERPASGVPVRIDWGAAEALSVWSGRTDEEGWAEVRLPRPDRGGDLRVFAGDTEQLVARGTPELTVDTWRGAARSRSGSVEGSNEGPLDVTVRVRRGVLAVPFPGELDLWVRRDGRPVDGAELSWQASGLRVDVSSPLRTTAEGYARLVVTPEEHVVSLELRARSSEGQGRWFSTLPVVAGAMAAESVGAAGVDDVRAGGILEIRSPIQRDSAWITWVSSSGRLGGQRVDLLPAAWGASGRVTFSAAVLGGVGPGDLWVVVSSEPDARSPSAVGWPLGDQGATFDAVEGRLLDGAELVAARQQGQRALLRWAVASYALLAGLLCLGALRHQAQVHRRQLLGHWTVQEGSERASAFASRGVFRWLVASLCVALGFLLIALSALLRAH